MTKETFSKIIHDGAQIHGFIQRDLEKDEAQILRQNTIYKFADYLVENFEEA